jgi:23S rRNA (adenine2503-C2)-methyltransferase
MSNIWNSYERLDSSNESVAKYVFKKDDALVEAVLYKYPTYEDRTVMCISVMCGCPLGCTFCGTGKFFARNLTIEEIVDQVEIMIEDKSLEPEKIKSWQIMTMSMGEPMLNLHNLNTALNILNTKYPQARLLVSTAAPKVDYTSFYDLASVIDTIGLQFSVHESTDEARAKLVKFKNKMTIAEMARAGEEFFLRTGRHPFFNYCVHEDNNSIEDVKRLLAEFDPKIWQSTLSVICEKDETIAQSVERQAAITQEFADKMIKGGYSTRVFNPAGQDDSCGCGQLWQVQKWAKENPDKVKKSIGAI